MRGMLRGVMLPGPRCQLPMKTHVTHGAVHYICPKCDGRAGNLALLRRTVAGLGMGLRFRKSRAAGL